MKSKDNIRLIAPDGKTIATFNLNKCGNGEWMPNPKWNKPNDINVPDTTIKRLALLVMYHGLHLDMRVHKAKFMVNDMLVKRFHGWNDIVDADVQSLVEFIISKHEGTDIRRKCELA